MDEIHFLIENAIEGGFVARCKETSIFTEAETLIEIKEKIKDAVSVHFLERIPRLVRLRIIVDEIMIVK